MANVKKKQIMKNGWHQVNQVMMNKVIWEVKKCQEIRQTNW